MIALPISIADVKARISEIVAKSQHAQQRFLLTRRAKPVAAIVSLEDLQWLQQREERQGLAAIAGKWQGFEEVAQSLEDLTSIRQQGGMGRNVSL
jgi:prevent-host-death family protein